MIRSSTKKLDKLINYNVTRTLLPNYNAYGSDIPEQQYIYEADEDELPEPPTDGFIAHYCYKNNK